MDIIEKITGNVSENTACWNAVESAIEECGVDIPEGTPKTEYADKVSEVYEAGRKAEYDAFWDAFQNYGNRKSYRGAFGSCFTADNFKPKYPIVPKRTYNNDNAEAEMFYYTNRDNPNNPIDLSDYPIDLSHLNDNYVGGTNTVFRNAYVENVFVDLAGFTSIGTLFIYGDASRSPNNIRFRITESTTTIGDILYYVARFENSKLTLSFTEDSVLVASLRLGQTEYITPEGIRNIFGVMSDSATGQTLTLKTAAVTNAFGSVDSEEWQTLVASKPNWTISLT